jgi:NTE family protein
LQSKIGVRKIEELKIPFRAVATDLFTGKTVVFKKGDLGLAIRSSCAVPFLFSPAISDDKCLVDGGISMPVPVQVVKEMGADIVIAVNLDSEYFIQEQKKRNFDN